MCNPILNIVPDDMYVKLMKLNLLNKKAIRDIEIRQKYVRLRNEGITAVEAVDKILSEYPYLQFDTMRKIIYSVRLPDEVCEVD